MTDYTGNPAAAVPPADPAPPAAGGKSDRRLHLPPRSRGGWVRPAFWLLLTAGVIFMAVRSFKHSDFLAVFTRSGNAQGVLSHRGRVLVAFSDVSFGPERSLTADAGTVPTAKGEELYTLVYKDWPRRHERLGFGFAASNKGDLALDGKPTVVAAVVPHGFVAVPTFLPVVWWVRKAVRRRRRVRRGLCLHCGYPLPDAAGACPECGRLPDGTKADAPPAEERGRRSAARSTTLMLLALLLLCGVAVAAPFVIAARPTARPEFTPAEVAAGLDRRVAEFRVYGVPLTDALAALARQSGTRIVVAPDEPRVLRWNDDAPDPVTVQLRDVTVAVAVQTLLRAAEPSPWVGDRRSGLGGPRFAVTAADGVITVRRPPPEAEFVLRAYDVRDIVEPFSDQDRAAPEASGTADFLSSATQPAPDLGYGAGTLRGAAVGRLAEAVQTFVAPESWDASASPGGLSTAMAPVIPPMSIPPSPVPVPRPAELHEWDGRLVVLQTADNHRRIGALLDQFRAARPAPAGPRPPGRYGRGAE